MPRGRTPRDAAIARPVVPGDAQTARDAAVRRATSDVLPALTHGFVEGLESRRLLTTLQSGQTFDYLDANNQVVRVKLTGRRIVAEFIGALVSDTNRVTIRDLIPAPRTGEPSPPRGADLFQIYIAQASPDAQILISRVGATADGNDTATPFTGGSGTIRVVNSNAPNTPTISPDGTGGVYIGARTRAVAGVTNGDNIPLTSNRFRSAFGVRPAMRTGLIAGVQTAAGVSLSKILIGGTVTGQVNIDGSLETFGAGNLLTGDANGLLVTGTRPTIQNNFQVGGDLQNLLVAGSVGTVSGGAAARVYRTGVDIRIGGKLGNLTVGNNFNGSVEVRVNGTRTVNPTFYENEYAVTDNTTAGTAFFDLVNEVTGQVGGNIIDDFVVNDTVGQYANSIGTGQTITWAGQIDSFANVPDDIDNYSLPLLAGQSVALQLNSLGLGALGVFDPLGRLVATDLTGSTRRNANEAFQFTATTPGVYRLAVLPLPRVSSTGAGTTAFETPPTANISFVYTLTATGVGNLSFGGAYVQGDTTFREDGIGTAIRTGDLGGWVGTGRVAGSTLALEAVNSGIGVTKGNLRAVVGGTIGNDVVNDTVSLDLVVPRGTIGLVQSTAGVLSINPTAIDPAEDAPNGLNVTGGDYQRIQASGSFIGSVVANGRIGTIIGGSINVPAIADSVPSTVIASNFNGRGTGGIDAIYTDGDLGTAGRGGAGIYSGAGGNLKYLHVGGTIYRDVLFGGSLANETVVRPGRAYSANDDSGTTGTITPSTVNTGTALTPVIGFLPLTGVATGGTSVQSPFTITDTTGNRTTTTDLSAGTITTTLIDRTAGTIVTTVQRRNGTSNTNLTSTTTTTGGLTIVPYPVRDGGVALARVESSTGVTVTARTGNGSFDITDLTTNLGGTAVVTGAQIGAGTVFPPITNPVPGTPTPTPTTPTGTGGGTTLPGAGGGTTLPGAGGGTTLPGAGGGTTLPGAGGGTTTPTPTPTTPTPTTPGTTTGSGNTRGGTTIARALAVPVGYQAYGVTQNGGLNVETNQPAVPYLLTFNGNSPVNVFHVQGNDVTSIYNNTGGEIASADVASLGQLTAETAGKIGSGIGGLAILLPTNLGTAATTGLVSTSFPFDALSRSIDVTGSALNITTRAGLGNVRIGDTVAAINPNIDGRNNPRAFDGITGSVQAANINAVNIGEGIGAGGTGNVAQAGVFATTNLVNLTGTNADVRGFIVSNRNIGTINLTNGSLINARVGTIAQFTNAAFTAGVRNIAEVGNAVNFNNLNITGNGGIIGSDVVAGSFGTVNVGGFGIVNSSISATATNQVNGSITAGGLGIRGSLLDVGTSIDSVTASGNGRVLDVNSFSSSVRQSSRSKSQFDTASGIGLSGVNDLNKLLGTSRSRGRINGMTNSGYMIDTRIVGTGDLGTLTANVIGSSFNGLVSTQSNSFPSRVSMGNSVGDINVANSVNGLQVTSGSLNGVNIGGTLQNAFMTIGGDVGAMNVGKYWRGSATLIARGNSGRIGTVTVGRELDGRIEAAKGIGTITADALGSSINSSGAIGAIRVASDILDTANIRVRRAIDNLIVDGDIDQGANISAASFGRVRVGGDTNGEVEDR